MYPPKTTAYPAFHLPRPRPRPASVRDSDTPSLSSSTSFSSLGSVSRSHSRRSSPPTSPAVLVTPIDQSVIYPHLAIIEERYVEDQEVSHRLSMESSNESVTAITFAVPELLPSTKMEDIQHDVPTAKKRMPHLEHLKLNAMSPHGSRSPSPSLLSPSRSSLSSSLSPVQPTFPVTKHPAVSFNRFIGSGGRNEKEKDAWSTTVQLASASVISFGSGTGGTKDEIKQRKAEEKQRKKAEAKAKTERLALELKEKARQRAAVQEKAASLHSSRSGDKKPVWVEGPSMFGALGVL